MPALIISLIFVAVFTYLTTRYIVDVSEVNHWILILLIGIVSAIILYAIIHELGHVIFGLLSGYQLDAFLVLSCAFVKSGNKYVIRRMHMPGTIGATLMHPGDRYEGRYALYILGGSITTLIASLIFTIVGILSSNPSYCLFFCEIALIGYILTIYNTMPLKQKDLYNDGMVLKLFRNDERAIELFNRSEVLTKAALNGIATKDLPSNIFEIPESYYTAPFASELLLNKAEYLIHNGKYAEAEAELTNLLKMTESNTNTLHDIAACFLIMLYLHTNSNYEQAEILYRENKKKIAALAKYYLAAKSILIACRMQFDHESNLDKEIREFYTLVKRQGMDCSFEVNFMKDLLQKNNIM